MAAPGWTLTVTHSVCLLLPGVPLCPFRVSRAAKQPEGRKQRGAGDGGHQPSQSATRAPRSAGPQRQLTALQPRLPLPLIRPAAPVKGSVGRDSGACAQDRVPTRALLLPCLFLWGADLAAETDTEQVCSQAQEGSTLFSSVRSDQAGLQGEKMIFDFISAAFTPYLSNLNRPRAGTCGWAGGRQSSRTWGGAL